jgi:autotransporter-associated beta strand protein
MHSAIMSSRFPARYILPCVMLAWLVGGLGQMAQAAQAPTVFQGGGVPASVPPNGVTTGTTDVTCLVSGINTPITRVTLSLFISHQYPADVRIHLVGPDGTDVGISLGHGGNNRGSPLTGYGTGVQDAPNGQVIFDDRSTAPIVFVNGFGGGGGGGGGQAQTSELPSIASPGYRPDEALSAFNGKSGTAVNGLWHLLVTDVDNVDTGLIQAWSLSITEGGGHIWTGGGTDNLWSNTQNWDATPIPAATETAAIIIFPAGAARTTNVNNIAGLQVTSLSVSAGYALSGNAIILNAGGSIAATGTAGAVDWAIPIGMRGAGTISVGAGVTMTDQAAGVISDQTGTAAGVPTKSGAGLLVVSAPNTYTGQTNINAGILRMNNATALGTTAGGIVVGSGGTLEPVSFAPAEAITLNGPGSASQGALSATQNLTWTSAITLGDDAASVGAAATFTLTLSGAITGNNQGFVKRDAGSVAVTVASLPTGTALDVKDGTLTLSATANPIASLAMTQGTLNFGANTLTLNGALTVTGSATGATISPAGGTLALSAGSHAFSIANGAANNDLTINCIVTGGTATKSGAGTLVWNAPSGNAPVTLSAGVLAGNGTMGALTTNGGTINPSGTINASSLIMNAASIFHVDGGDSLNVTGNVTLNNAILQPFTGTGTIIAGGATTSGTFRGMPQGAGIDYAGGSGNDVVLGLGSNTVAFGAAAYTVNEASGPANISVVSTGGSVTVAIAAVSGGTLGADFTLPAATTFSGAGSIQIPIINDNIAEGDEVVNLVLIPSVGFLAAPAEATLTIRDDDKDDEKKCGFGSGMTVFFLMLGFALVRLAGARRR